MKLRLLFFLAVLSSSALFSQVQPMDTVYLMSGKTVAGVVKDTVADNLKILLPKKGKPGEFKADFIDLDLVFSVKYRDGNEKVFYQQDTLFGNYYSTQEVRYFMQGERDATRAYRCPWWNVASFVCGFAGGFTQNFLIMPLPPFLVAAAGVNLRIKIRPGSVSNPDYLRYDTYLLGYEKSARQRRVFHSFIFGFGGVAAGFAYSAIRYGIK